MLVTPVLDNIQLLTCLYSLDPFDPLESETLFRSSCHFHDIWDF